METVIIQILSFHFYADDVYSYLSNLLIVGLEDIKLCNFLHLNKGTTEVIPISFPLSIETPYSPVII